MRSTPLERLTVHAASYRPLPLPLPAVRPKAPSEVRLGRRLATFEKATVYGDAFKSYASYAPPETRAPRDHPFPGDGLNRFDTSHRKDYGPIKSEIRPPAGNYAYNRDKSLSFFFFFSCQSLNVQVQHRLINFDCVI